MPGFTRSQHGKYRPIVEAAWQKHAAEHGIDPKSAADRRSWYERELFLAVGVSSTVAMDAGRDFDAAIAHFEALADNGETYWQTRAENGDLRRILHNVFPGNLHPQIDGHVIDREYCRKIAQQMLQLEEPPRLRSLRKDQIAALIRSLKIFRDRHAVR